jgi:hypothetical protein
MTVFGYKIAARAILIALAVLLVVAALLWGPAACRSMKTAGEQAKISKGQEGAAVDSGAEAMNTVSNVAGNSAATDATVEQSQGEVRAAPEGKKGAATVNAACRFKANRDKPQCKGASK